MIIQEKAVMPLLYAYQIMPDIKLYNRTIQVYCIFQIFMQCKFVHFYLFIKANNKCGCYADLVFHPLALEMANECRSGPNPPITARYGSLPAAARMLDSRRA